MALAVPTFGCGDDASDVADGGGQGNDQDAAAGGDKDAATGGDKDGGGDSEPVEAMITAKDGGKLETKDKSFTLTVPKGAVSEDVMISVREATADDEVADFETALGKQYVLEPDGLTFDKPIELSFTVSRADFDAAAKKLDKDYKGGDSEALLAALVSSSKGKLSMLTDQSIDLSDEDTVVITGKTTHFCTMAVIPGNVVAGFLISNETDGLVGPVGTEVTGNISISRPAQGNERLPALNATVTFDVTDADTAKIKTSTTKPSGTAADAARGWVTYASCNDVGKGIVTAKVLVTYALDIGKGLAAQSEIPLTAKYDCTEPETPPCIPSVLEPDNLPTVVINDNVTVCRGQQLFFESTNLSPDTCVTSGGVETKTECQTEGQGTYCMYDIPLDAEAGESTVKVRTAAGSATSEGTFEILDQNVPIITGFSPTSALAGATVTVTGTDLDIVSSLTFVVNGPPTTIEPTTKTETSMTFVIPQQAAAGEYELVYFTTKECGSSSPHDSITFTVTAPPVVQEPG